MSTCKLGLLRCPTLQINKVMLPRHRNLSDSCDSGPDKKDKKDTCGSNQDQGQATFDSGINNPSAPTAYECRKYGHNLPLDSVMPYFETLPCIPTGIFRCTAGEVLGAGASKKSQYQNPEYFSYHHMTFYDMHLILRSYRTECPDTGRKK